MGFMADLRVCNGARWCGSIDIINHTPFPVKLVHKTKRGICPRKFERLGTHTTCDIKTSGSQTNRPADTEQKEQNRHTDSHVGNSPRPCDLNQVPRKA